MNLQILIIYNNNYTWQKKQRRFKKTRLSSRVCAIYVYKTIHIRYKKYEISDYIKNVKAIFDPDLGQTFLIHFWKEERITFSPSWVLLFSLIKNMTYSWQL